MVRAPSVEEEDARRTTRERANLLKERVRHVNRIKGLLAGQGVYDFEPLRPDRLERLGALVTGDGRPLPERLAAEVRRHLRRLELVLEMLEEVEASSLSGLPSSVGGTVRLPPPRLDEQGSVIRHRGWRVFNGTFGQTDGL